MTSSNCNVVVFLAHSKQEADTIFGCLLGFKVNTSGDMQKRRVKQK